MRAENIPSAEELLSTVTKIRLDIEDFVHDFKDLTRGYYNPNLKGLYVRDTVREVLHPDITFYLVHCARDNTIVEGVDMDRMTRPILPVWRVEDKRGKVLINSRELQNTRYTVGPTTDAMIYATIRDYICDQVGSQRHWMPQKPNRVEYLHPDIDYKVFGSLSPLFRKVERVLNRRPFDLIDIQIQRGLMTISFGPDFRILEYTRQQERESEEEQQFHGY